MLYSTVRTSWYWARIGMSSTTDAKVNFMADENETMPCRCLQLAVSASPEYLEFEYIFHVVWPDDDDDSDRDPRNIADRCAQQDI
jgi:hypothetical protein